MVRNSVSLILVEIVKEFLLIVYKIVLLSVKSVMTISIWLQMLLIYQNSVLKYKI